jgi:small-conductance mechanosensitive channel
MDQIRVWVETLLTLLITDLIPRLFGVAMILIFGSILLNIVTRLIGLTATRARVKTAIIDLTRAAVSLIGWTLIIAGIMGQIGLSELSLALGGTISFIALGIATAANGNLADIIAGVFLASDPDFGNGFTVTSNNIAGRIERIDLRKTRIRAADGKLYIVPNRKIESEVWIVEGRPEEPPPVNIFPRGFPIPGRRRDQPPQQSPQQPGANPQPPTMSQ